jgi:DeoR family fructose operon transcriptional repressor
MVILNDTGEVKITSLGTQFAVTEMTIRRDLEKLEQIGYARRTFGGAILIDKDIALRERVDIMKEEKVRIGKKAAELVLPGESIFIDAGTTTVQMVRFLKPDSNITVVTNALNVAGELQEKGITTIVIGGNLIETTFSLAGPIAAATLSGMAFDRVFLGATGCTGQHGFSNSNMHEAEIKKIAVKQAGEVNVMLDHTKFGAKQLVSFASLKQVQRIITDRLPNEELMIDCTANDVSIVDC